MHWAHAFIDPLAIHGLIPEVEVVGVAVIGNAISLDAIADPLKLATTSLILALPLHLASLLIKGEILGENPSFLPNMVAPTKQFIDLDIGAFLFCWCWGYHCWILAAKEIPKGAMHLLVPRSNMFRDEVVPMRPIL